MGRNLYILAFAIGALALLCLLLSFTNFSHSSSHADALLWRTSAVALVCVALVAALAGVLSSLFEQAERRANEERRRKRRR